MKTFPTFVIALVLFFPAASLSAQSPAPRSPDMELHADLGLGALHFAPEAGSGWFAEGGADLRYYRAEGVGAAVRLGGWVADGDYAFGVEPGLAVRGEVARGGMLSLTLHWAIGPSLGTRISNEEANRTDIGILGGWTMLGVDLGIGSFSLGLGALGRTTADLVGETEGALSVMFAPVMRVGGAWNL